MTALELRRAPSDRRLYSLAGAGTLRLEGLLGSRATAVSAAGDTWRFATRGLLQRTIEATDPVGDLVGEFHPRDILGGGALRWQARELALRPASALRERYVLRDGGGGLLRIDGKGWGRRPVEITLGDPDGVDPGLLLFTAFVVHRLATEASGAAAAPTSTARSAAAF